MPSTLTLKDIPDEIYDRLKAAAKAHRCSPSSEAIACLKSVLMPERVSAIARLERARALRAELPHARYDNRDIDALKRERRW